MVFAIVDDLIFMSKIRSSASRIGVSIVTPRSAADAIDDMRKQPPALVILDLNNRRADALGTFAAMKAEPTLEHVPVVAFAGHTQIDLLDAARRAGVRDVLTRGALNELLPEILARTLN
jgi:CheY-like chemotaxis protein